MVIFIDSNFVLNLGEDCPSSWLLLICCFKENTLFSLFLAHLSLRLIVELILDPWSGVRPSSVHIFKDLQLLNHLANKSQILYGASLGKGNESLFAASVSHDQDGRHVHIW